MTRGTKRRYRKLKPEHIPSYFAGLEERMPGWSVTVLQPGDHMLLDGCYVPDKPGRATAWSLGWLGVVQVHNAEHDVTLEFRFSDQIDWTNEGGRAGWRVRTWFKGKEDRLPWVDIIAKRTSTDQRRAATSAKGALQVARGRYRKDRIARQEVEPVKAQRVAYSGTTRFHCSGGYRTFDRHGVEDSFYSDDQQYPTPDDLCQHELARALEARERIEASEPIPCSFGWLVTPQRKAEIGHRLQQGGAESFMPSGFGIGKVLYGRPTHGARRAPDAIAEFFGCTNLWMSEFEAD